MRHILLLTAWFWSVAGVADVTCEPMLAITRPYFYRLEKDGQTSYLLGTVHAGVSLGHLPAGAREIMDECTDLTVEYTPGSALAEAASSVLQRALLRRTFEPRLSARLSPLEFRELQTRLSQNGLPFEMADELSAMGASLLADPKYRDYLRDIEVGRLDVELVDRIRGRGRPVRSLESLFVQVRASYRALSLENLRTILSPDSSATLEDVLTSRGNLYRAGDPAGYEARLRAMRDGSEAAFKYYMTDRNLRWAPKIERTHRTPGRHLFAVGDTHLFGADGLLELLRARGFTIKRYGTL